MVLYIYMRCLRGLCYILELCICMYVIYGTGRCMYVRVCLRQLVLKEQLPVGESKKRVASRVVNPTNHKRSRSSTGKSGST
jgi:hypothetical protein